MFKKYFDIFAKFTFFPVGIAIFSTIGGIVMGIMAYLTVALKTYAPLSYAIGFIVGIIAILIVMILIVSIWIAISQRVSTKKPTFVEYSMEDGRINIVDSSNIYREPSVTVIENIIKQGNRKQKRANNNLEDKKELSLDVRVLFDKPIRDSDFLCRVEKIGGKKPTKEASRLENRSCSLILRNVERDCSFRICFTRNSGKNNE